jgi:hypothetical protein
MAVLLVAVAAGSGPAVAGGGRMAPVRDRYEPGQSATLVGYTGGPVLDPDLLDEPFYAYLRPVGDGSVPALDDSGVYVGDLVLRKTGHRGYLELRVSVTFDIPENLPPGEYEITYCEDPCAGRFLGDLLPSPVSIGVDPARPVIREWAADEPEIANLPPGAVRSGPAPQAAPPPAPPSSVMATTSPALVTTQAPPPPSPAVAEGDDGDMAWPVPTLLVLGSAAATALVLSRRQRSALRAAASRRPEAPAADRIGVGAGRG